jgi:hypothetical protein
MSGGGKGLLFGVLVGGGLAAYQLVGGVVAYQGGDG